MDIISTSGKHAVEIKAIVDHFFHSKVINCFSHSRIFADGSRAELWSDAVALEHTYLKTNYTTVSHAPRLYKPEEKHFFLNDKIETFSPQVKRNYEVHLGEQRELFNHDNTLIVRGDDELCAEFFCFYGPKGDYQTKIFFLSNLSLIHAFTKVFKKKASKLIKLAEEDRIVIPWIKKETGIPDLTQRERQVAQQLTYSRTAREIGDILDLKRRTIEGYIAKIKDKYLCNKKSELIKLLRQNPFLFTNKIKNDEG